MAKVCMVTGKKTQRGNIVSHSNIKTKRTFEPNLQWKRFWIESQNRWVRLRVCKKGLKTIDKKGIEVVLAELAQKA